MQAWFGALPATLAALSTRWQIELNSAIARGSVSAVFRCRMADGRSAVLKVTPDVERLASETAALRLSHTVHTPAVIAHDRQLGALLLQAIEPGTPLDESSIYPAAKTIGELLNCLHAPSTDDRPFPSVGQRVRYLFDSGARLYERYPHLAHDIRPALYERGRRLAMQLAQPQRGDVLLHGDLTPRNILDGGSERGLVAIDPAPCFGDPAFDAVDLILWQADGPELIRERMGTLAVVAGLDERRLAGWCAAFAAMAALDLATERDTRDEHVGTLLELASQTPEGDL